MYFITRIRNCIYMMFYLNLDTHDKMTGGSFVCALSMSIQGKCLAIFRHTKHPLHHLTSIYLGDYVASSIITFRHLTISIIFIPPTALWSRNVLHPCFLGRESRGQECDLLRSHKRPGPQPWPEPGSHKSEGEEEALTTGQFFHKRSDSMLPEIRLKLPHTNQAISGAPQISGYLKMQLHMPESLCDLIKQWVPDSKPHMPLLEKQGS